MYRIGDRFWIDGRVYRITGQSDVYKYGVRKQTIFILEPEAGGLRCACDASDLHNYRRLKNDR